MVFPNVEVGLHLRKKLVSLAVAVTFLGIGLFLWSSCRVKENVLADLIRTAEEVAGAFSVRQIRELGKAEQTGPRWKLFVRQQRYLENTLKVFPEVSEIRVYLPSSGGPVLVSGEEKTASPHETPDTVKTVFKTGRAGLSGTLGITGSVSPFHVFVPRGDSHIGKTAAVVEVEFRQKPLIRYLGESFFAHGLVTVVFLLVLFFGAGGMSRLCDTSQATSMTWFCRNVEALAVLAAGVCFTVFAAYHIYQTETTARERAFERLARAENSKLLSTMRNIENYHMEALGRFFESSVQVDIAEFREFSGFMMEEPSLWGWGWAPSLRKGQEKAFEIRAAVLGVKDFRIREHGSPDVPLPSGSDSRLYPLLFAGPAGKGLPAIGLDFGSVPDFQKAITTAVESGFSTATAPLRFSVGKNAFSGILVFRPVYFGGGSLRGLVIGFLDEGILLSSGAGAGKEAAFPRSLRFFQVDPGGNALLVGSRGSLNTSGNGSGITEDPRVISLLHAFGKTYVLETFPDSAFAGLYPLRGWILAVFGGLFLSGLLATLTGSQMWKRRNLALQVEEKTKALGESEERYKSIFENSHAAMLVIDPDDGSIIDANPASETFYGWTCSELQTMKISEINTLPPKEVLAEMRRAREEQRTFFSFKHRRSDGSVVDVDVYTGPVLMEGKTLLFSIIHDVTARHRAEDALRESEQRQNAFINTHEDMMFVKDDQFRYVIVNEATARFFGRSKEEILDRSDFGLMAEEAAALCYESDLRALQSGKTVVVEEPVGERVYETTKFPVPLKGGKTGLGGIIRDVTERRYFENQLRHFATHDELTGVANRTLLRDRIHQAVLFAQRAQRHVAVLLIDLDRFKILNDSLGHSFGDELLRAVARRLETIVREGDTVARLGGDEFVILLAHIAREEDVHTIVSKILEETSRPYVINRRAVTVTASIGFSLSPRDGSDSETLIRLADVAMYEAKRKGRNVVQQYMEGMDRSVMETHETEADLRGAIDRGELFLEFQPVAEVDSGRVQGVESLIRWRHPKYGVVPPAHFIPLAEETRLIVPIGEWVLRQACGSIKRLEQSGFSKVPVSVNLSAVQFRSESIVETVKSCLSEHSIEPQLVILELTESHFVHDPRGAAETMQRLSKLGVRLALDDFGTGYSSLNYLRRFPVNALKIDRSFVHDAIVDPSAAAIVSSIVAIAHSLGLKTIAEGVETEEQLAFVKGWGCDAYQGYLYSKPLMFEDLKEFLRKKGTGFSI
ncbi:MAG: EAL domain-containing protein [Thermovirgaceae bacterium]